MTFSPIFALSKTAARTINVKRVTDEELTPIYNQLVEIIDAVNEACEEDHKPARTPRALFDPRAGLVDTAPRSIRDKAQFKVMGYCPNYEDRRGMAMQAEVVEVCPVTDLMLILIPGGSEDATAAQYANGRKKYEERRCPMVAATVGKVWEQVKTLKSLAGGIARETDVEGNPTERALVARAVTSDIDTLRNSGAVEQAQAQAQA